MEEFLKNFKSVRNMQTLVPSRDQGVPLELHQQAKDLVTSQRHQYSVLNIYDIIVHNLKAGRKVENIKQGLFSISKYPLCLFLDQERPEFHQIRTFSGYYTYEIKEQMESFEPILEAMGYRYDKQTQLYKLDKDIRLNAGFDDKIALIGCELLLAYEELSLFQGLTKNSKIDPILHFSTFLATPRNYSQQSDQDRYHAQYEPNAIVNPNTNVYKGLGNPLNPYPDMGHNQQGQVYPPTEQINMNISNLMANRPLPIPPSHQSGQTELPEEDMYPYKQPHHNKSQMAHTVDARKSLSHYATKNPTLEEIGEPDRPAGMRDQRNVSPQNRNFDPSAIQTATGMDNQKTQRDLGAGGMSNSRYQVISPSNQGINHAEQREYDKPPNQQDMIPTETGRNYQGIPQGMNPPDISRGVMGRQGYQGANQGMNTQDISRDVMGGQGYQGANQGMNTPDISRGVMGGQGYQGANQGMNTPDISRGVMGGQGYQGPNQGMNPPDISRGVMGGQGYQGANQGMNTQDISRDVMGGQGYQGANQGMNTPDISRGVMGGQGYQGPNQGMNPPDISRGVMGGQGYQGANQGMNTQDISRDLMGGQGYQGANQGMNPPDISRDVMGGQGYQGANQGANQGMNPPDISRDVMGGQGYQGPNQGMNPPDISRGVMGGQGYQGANQGANQGMNTPDISRGVMGGQGYQGPNQGMNPPDISRGVMGGQGYQGANQGMNTQDISRDLMGGQGYQGANQGMNPPDISRDVMGGQGYQGANQGANQGMNTPDISRGVMGGQGYQGPNQGMNPPYPRIIKGGGEYNHPWNPEGEAENIVKPMIGPKPTGIIPGGNIQPTPINPASENMIQPHLPAEGFQEYLKCFQDKPLTIHSETPRHISMEKNEGELAPKEVVQLPTQGMNEQQANANVAPHRKQGLFESCAFETNHTSELHETLQSDTNIEKQISQEHQRSSGEQNRFSGKQHRFSGHHDNFSGQQDRFSGQQDPNFPMDRQMRTRASEQNLSQRVNSPPFQPLQTQVSDNTYPGPQEQSGGHMRHLPPQQHQFEPGMRYDETQVAYGGGNPVQYCQEKDKNQQVYSQTVACNSYQDQIHRANMTADINRGMQQMNLKADVPPTQYQHQEMHQGPMGDVPPTQYQHQEMHQMGDVPPTQYQHQEMHQGPVAHYQATGELYHSAHQRAYPQDNPAYNNAPYKGPEENKATGQVYTHPPIDSMVYPYEPHIEKHQVPHFYDDENMPFPHPQPDFSRPVGPNPNHPRYQEPQRPESYNNPDMYRDPVYRQDQDLYSPHQDPQRQFSEAHRPYRDPHIPYLEKGDDGDEFRRPRESDPRMDHPEDRKVSFQEKMARFQQQPAPIPSHQQQVSDKPWNCPHCTFQNAAFRKVCDVCAKTPDFQLGPDQAVPTHKKMCNFCKRLNSVDARACMDCGRNFLPNT